MLDLKNITDKELLKEVKNRGLRRDELREFEDYEIEEEADERNLLPSARDLSDDELLTELDDRHIVGGPFGVSTLATSIYNDIHNNKNVSSKVITLVENLTGRLIAESRGINLV